MDFLNNLWYFSIPVLAGAGYPLITLLIPMFMLMGWNVRCEYGTLKEKLTGRAVWIYVLIWFITAPVHASYYGSYFKNTVLPYQRELGRKIVDARVAKLGLPEIKLMTQEEKNENNRKIDSLTRLRDSLMNAPIHPNK